MVASLRLQTVKRRNNRLRAALELAPLTIFLGIGPNLNGHQAQFYLPAENR
jgi:hypothetical protein